MERLTDCASGYCETYCKEYGHCQMNPEICEFKNEVAMYAKLKDYEHTGLEPETASLFRGVSYNSGVCPARLAELAQADMEGRLVVLPCKAGDTVYVTDLRKGEAVPCEVLCYSALDGTGNGIIEYKVPREIPDIVSVEASMEEIGKTVFLTREEAEKALEGGGSDG